MSTHPIALNSNQALGLEEAARGFAAVGSEPRLAIVLTLVRAGPEGLTVGEIQERVGFPASTLAHHLRFLVEAGLLDQQKRGRAVVNRAVFEHVEALARFLVQACCADARASGVETAGGGNP